MSTLAGYSRLRCCFARLSVDETIFMVYVRACPIIYGGAESSRVHFSLVYHVSFVEGASQFGGIRH
eukprot:5234102-Pyramimonas_sp.AAC.1